MPLSPHPYFSVSRALCPEPHAVGALGGEAGAASSEDSLL